MSDNNKSGAPPTIDAEFVVVQAPSPAKAAAAKRKRKKAPKGKAKAKPKRAQSIHEAKKEIARMEHIKEALDYRRQGYTYAEIAEAMGSPTSTCYEWVKAGIRMIPAEEAADVRAMELDRLDTMQSKAFSEFLDSGDYAAADFVLKIMDRRARYMGMYRESGDSAEAAMSMSESLTKLIAHDPPKLFIDEPAPAHPVL